MTRVLDVYFRDTKAGLLCRLDDGLLTFAYNARLSSGPTIVCDLVLDAPARRTLW